MKLKIVSILSFLILFFLASCEKENITNSYFEDNPGRQGKIEQDVKHALASSPKGWVMMVKSDLSTEIYTPIVLKFDTLRNRVDIKTVYGTTADNEVYYRVATGNGTPQLTFSTGSVISTLYRMGGQASDITDHMFNIVKVDMDSIFIQSYRSGGTRAKEGGAIYKLFKRPDAWTWADDSLMFDYSSSIFRAGLTEGAGKMVFQYAVDNQLLETPWRFWNWGNATIESTRNRDPFSHQTDPSRGGFKPLYPMLVTGIQGETLVSSNNVVPLLGHNAIALYPFTHNNNTNLYVRSLIKFIKTHYLVFKKQERTGQNVKMEFEAYNRQGEPVVKAYYDNLR